MKDITYCAKQNCPYENECERKEIPNETMVWYGNFEECKNKEYFIERRENND